MCWEGIFFSWIKYFVTFQEIRALPYNSLSSDFHQRLFVFERKVFPRPTTHRSIESFFYHRPLQWPLLAQNIYWVIVPLMPKPCPYKGDVARAKQQGTQRNFRNFVPSLPSRNLPSGQLLPNNGRTEGNFLKQTWGPQKFPVQEHIVLDFVYEHLLRLL